MTDEALSSAETEELSSYPIRPGLNGSEEVNRRGDSGEEVTSEPVSEDPAVNVIGELSLRQNQAIAEDAAHPDHAAVVEYNRLWMNHLRPTIDAMVKTTETGRRAADVIAKSVSQAAGISEIVLKASTEPMLISEAMLGPVSQAAGISEIVLKASTEPMLISEAMLGPVSQAAGISEIVLKASTEPMLISEAMLGPVSQAAGISGIVLKASTEPDAGTAAYIEPIAQRYKQLVATAMPDMRTSALIELPKTNHVQPGQAFGEEPNLDPVELPRIGDALVDLLTEQNGKLQVQIEALASLLTIAQGDAKAAGASEVRLRSDSKQMKVGMWIGLAIGVVGAAAALLALV
ncbi:hypothetical protein ACFS27_08900 [Promicromonospora vindobonensis]|uniref:Uncharacterized protein n=1 Tax=Promicromonospora vindobonensis TaxID=195748 RepID=A0ABW5VQU2_9MICO